MFSVADIDDKKFYDNVDGLVKLVDTVIIPKMFNDKALRILRDRYMRQGETPGFAMWRVAKHVANGNISKALQYYAIMCGNRFLPNTPTWTGAGQGKGQLAACFVLPIEDTMESIFGTLRDAALIQSTGGGTGFSFGKLRPRGALVESSQGTSSGPISFIRAYDGVFETVKQGGTRRGANMGMLPVWHPDIFDFINCKHVEGAITNFNLSVAISDDFMHAVRANATWALKNPQNHSTVREVPAVDLFNAIIESSLRNGEPGVVFIDAINRENPADKLFRIEATNPCITANCVVCTRQGPMYVSELVGKRFHTIEHVQVKNGFFKSRSVTSICRLQTQMGYTLTCTPEHRIMTDKGWKRVDEIDIETDLVELGMNQCCHCNDDRVAFLAYKENIVAYTRQILGGNASLEVCHTMQRFIDCAQLTSTVEIIRVLWTYAGRPNNALVFLPEVNLPLIESIHDALLRIGIISSIEIDEEEQTTLIRISPSSIVRFAHVVENNAPTSDICAALKNTRVNTAAWDKIATINEIAYDEPIDVFDATTDPDFNNPTLWTGVFKSHNCSEVPLSAYECCCLGSINLSNHFCVETGTMDYVALSTSIYTAVQYLDDVITANKFVPAVPQLEVKAKETRRIGLGITGLADVLFKARIRYGSPDALRFVAELMEHIRFHALFASTRLAFDKGPFPLYESTRYKTGQYPFPTAEGLRQCMQKTFGIDLNVEDRCNWAFLERRIKENGLRNITVLAIAPTGTLSLVAGVNGFGCEPVFALSHQRRVLDKQGQPQYMHMVIPELEQILNESIDDEGARTRAMEHIMRTGTCVGCSDIPPQVADVFVCATDLSTREHIAMQAVLQHYTDGAISKTINMPPGSTATDVSNAYFTAWESGCKGVCVYITGSRSIEVLSAGTKKN